MLVSMPFKNNQTSDPPKKLAIKIINISVYAINIILCLIDKNSELKFILFVIYT